MPLLVRLLSVEERAQREPAPRQPLPPDCVSGRGRGLTSPFTSLLPRPLPNLLLCLADTGID